MMRDLIFRDAKECVKFEYELRKARRPAYSLRAFARDLEVSPSSLTDFLKGRVGMSKERIDDIADRLNWSLSKKDHFYDLVVSQHSGDQGEKIAAQTRVKARLKEGAGDRSLDAFRTMSEWHHLVILEICEMNDHVTPAAVAKDLGIPQVKVVQAFKRLFRLNLLNETANGPKPTEVNNHFGDDVPSQAVVEFHLEMLDLAEKALRTKEMNERESQSMFFSVRKKDIPEMNSEIRRALFSIVNKYAQKKDRDSVQALTLQSFSIFERSGK